MKRWLMVPGVIAVIGLSGWAMSGCGEDLALKTLPPITTPIRQAASPVSGSLNLFGYSSMATGTQQCWSWVGTFPVKNYYGQTKYTYKEWLGWCTDHNTVTRILWHANDSYGSNVWHNQGCNVQDQYSVFGYDNYHVYGSCWMAAPGYEWFPSWNQYPHTDIRIRGNGWLDGDFVAE